MKLIAELSMNHGGDMNLAKKMVTAAANAGADYAKFQTWKVKNLKPGPWDNDGRREIYQSAELSEQNHFDLKKCCEENGIKFLTSCFSVEDLDFVRTVTNEIKIPSPECVNQKLVEKAISLFDTVFLSVGSSTYDEYSVYAQHPNVFLLHCVSVYPCPYEQINLSKMMVLKGLTERYGYSGHAEGSYDALAAISLGAAVVEKHFTIDHNLPFRDNKFSILPDELKMISDFATFYEKMLIPQGSDFQDGEKVVREQYSGRWQRESHN